MTKEIDYFKNAHKANEEGNPEKAYELHIKAFEENPHLAKLVLEPNHPHYNYEYKLIDEVKIINCPLCLHKGKPHWAYNMIVNENFREAFSPIRIWYYCKKCHHLFAHNYPKQLTKLLKDNIDPRYLQPLLYVQNNRLQILGQIVSGIKEHNIPKYPWLDVGFGTGEMLLIIKEHGFEAVGVDIRVEYVNNFKQYDNEINVYCKDFENDDISGKYGVIMLGDVLEHFIDPHKVIKKVSDILVKNGILWISTPNFESTFSKFVKHKDPMHGVCEHINYFSYTSLSKLLVQYGFKIEDYQVSGIYNGCMEVIARKIK